ncbi:sulfotransferase family protein [Afifella sp. IM 167]|uniref:sulfotransferase family protein n=1 Tax=Afifella sp. IM 167 TaxID=2033586 RepID=UPI001CCB2D17|nr:sulfotransferase family protein [Afifella sp. IM 167]MBZ8134874.1 hypothetical protein [Afifella sp. IM 167]
MSGPHDPGDPGRPLYLFCHVPKCAGSTVEGHFDRYMKERLLYPPRRRSFLRDLGGGYTDMKKMPKELDRLDFIGGHSLSRNVASLFPARDIRECVLIRDPLSLAVSYYNFRNKLADLRGKGTAPFSMVYRSFPRDIVCRFILTRYVGFGYPRLLSFDSARRFAEVERLLREFWFVAGLEHTNEMLNVISRNLGIGEMAVTDENVSNRPGALTVADVPQEIARDILARNPLDALLYARWKDVKWGPAPEPLPQPLPRGDQTGHILFEIRRLVAGKKVDRLRAATAPAG